MYDFSENSENRRTGDNAPGRGVLFYLRRVVDNILVAVLTFFIFYLSLLSTSVPVDTPRQKMIERAIERLEAKGFKDDAALLRRAVFRSTDNWLNALLEKENAYAATNFPFGIVTVYDDFYYKTTDDTERAMILLHEARHLRGAGETEAYAYVWRSRHRLGWTMIPYGTTESYVTIDILTREHAPYLFRCPDRLWNDCTEAPRELKITRR